MRESHLPAVSRKYGGEYISLSRNGPISILGGREPRLSQKGKRPRCRAGGGKFVGEGGSASRRSWKKRDFNLNSSRIVREMKLGGGENSGSKKQRVVMEENLYSLKPMRKRLASSICDDHKEGAAVGAEEEEEEVGGSVSQGKRSEALFLSFLRRGEGGSADPRRKKHRCHRRIWGSPGFSNQNPKKEGRKKMPHPLFGRGKVAISCRELVLDLKGKEA